MLSSMRRKWWSAEVNQGSTLNKISGIKFGIKLGGLARDRVFLILLSVIFIFTAGIATAHSDRFSEKIRTEQSGILATGSEKSNVPEIFLFAQINIEIGKQPDKKSEKKNEPQIKINTPAVLKSFTQKVPELRHISLSEAKKICSKYKLKLKIVEERHSKLNKGLIISQTPNPGASIPKDRYVRVTISKGSPLVPNVVGQTVSGARQKYRNLKPSIQVSSREHSSSKAGVIIRQSPRAGTPYSGSLRLSVVESLGSRRVPSVVGQTVSGARQRYRNLKPSIQVSSREHSSSKAGVIIRQSPKSGAAYTGSLRLSVVESLGPRLVPNVIGQTISRARQQNEAMKADIRVGAKEHSQSKAGTIIRQTPKAGTAYSGILQLNVVVSLGPWIVPNIVGQTLSGARQTHMDLKLDIRVTSKEYSNSKAGIILRQTPKAGTAYSGNLQLTVVESLGPRQVPNTVGLTVSEARQQYRDLKPSIEVNSKEHAESKPGVIIHQTPKAGTPYSGNLQLSVVESLGPPIAPNLVPNMVGQTEQGARDQYSELSLVTQFSDEQPLDITPGTIYKQEPRAGEVMPEDRRISVWVSREELKVPNLLGMTLNDARNSIDSEDKLSVQEAGSEHSREKRGIIFRQSPDPNTSVPQNRLILVWLSLGQPQVPNLLGMTIAEAQRHINRLPISIEIANDNLLDSSRLKISRQLPAEGSYLSEDSFIKVWLSEDIAKDPDYWKYVIGIGGALLLIGGISFLVKKIKPRAVRPVRLQKLSLRVKPHFCPGAQEVEMEDDHIAGPAFSVRTHSHSGWQSVEPSKIDKKEKLK